MKVRYFWKYSLQIKPISLYTLKISFLWWALITLQPRCSITCSENIFMLIGIDCRSVKIGQSMGPKKCCAVWSRVRRDCITYMLNRFAKTFALISECTRAGNQCSYIYSCKLQLYITCQTSLQRSGEVEQYSCTVQCKKCFCIQHWQSERKKRDRFGVSV